MKVYRNHYFASDDDGESRGFDFFSSVKKARASHRQHAQCGNSSKRDIVAEPFDVEITKAGILAALNKLAGHAYNG